MFPGGRLGTPGSLPAAAAIEHRIDIHTLAGVAAQEVIVNDIGRVRIELQQPLPLRPYRDDQAGVP